MLLLQAGLSTEAREHFERAAELFPRSFNAHLNLGNLELRSGRYPEAIAAYEAALSLRPRSAMVEERLRRARRLAQSPRTGR